MRDYNHWPNLAITALFIWSSSALSAFLSRWNIFQINWCAVLIVYGYNSARPILTDVLQNIDEAKVSKQMWEMNLEKAFRGDDED